MVLWSYMSQDASNDPPHGLIQEVGSFQRSLEASTLSYKLEEYGSFQRGLEMSTHLYTWLGEHWNSVGWFQNLPKSSCTQTSVGASRLFLSCKEPSKVPESSIGAYKQVRLSFGQDTTQKPPNSLPNQASDFPKALVKLPLSNKSFHFSRVAYYVF